MDTQMSEPTYDLAPLEAIIANVGGNPTNVIAILQQAQDAYGYLPKYVIYRVAEACSVSPADVMGVATFYTQFRLAPVGRHLIMSCQGTACHVNASERISTVIQDYLGIANGETTADGAFTLEEVACLGCCSLAPVIMIDGEAYGNLTPDKAIATLKAIQKRDREEAAGKEEPCA